MNGSTHSIVRDFVQGVFFFRNPRRTATRREWCAFFLVAALLCAAAYLVMGGVAALLQTVGDDDTLRHALGDGYYTVMDGGPTGFSVAALLLAVPFLVVSVRRLRDAGLSPWWLLLPPVLAAVGVGCMLYCLNEDPGLLYGEPLADSPAAWVGGLSLVLSALADAAALALVAVMAFRKSRK